MAHVLLTGFEPFGGERVNPSWQAVSLLAQRSPEVAAVELPCVFDASLPALRAALDRHTPELVVCVGQAGGRAGVTPERVAINLLDARIPDNAGAQPVDQPVLPGGPAAYFTSLPVKACVAAIQRAGVPAAVSHTAGTFVCNQVFYGLMHLLTERPGVRGGFVHVPYSPEQCSPEQRGPEQRHPEEAGSAPSLPVADCAEALDVLVRTALSTGTDLRISGGSLH